MDFADIFALTLFILGLFYIAYWYLKRHFIGTRDGESTCSKCGNDLSLEKETIFKKIIKRFYLKIDFISKKHRVEEIWVCGTCNNKVTRTVSFGY